MAHNSSRNNFLMTSTRRHLASSVNDSDGPSYFHSRSNARNLMNVSSDMHWSNSKNMANMPIFEDNEISSNSNCDIYIMESPEEYGQRNIVPRSSALKALQGYGNKLHSPVPLVHDNCGIDETHNKKSFTNPASTNMMHSSTFLEQKYNDDVPTKSSVTIDNLNLKTVDEEDEYLYGDSSSLPEEPTVNKDSLIITPNIPNSEWSDEEEYFGRSPRDQNKIKLNLNSCSMNTVQHKTDVSELSQIKYGERSSNPVLKLPETTILGNMPTQSSINTSVVSTKNNTKLSKNVPKAINLSEISVSGNKTKYHLAAQKLKQQIYEKANKSLSDSARSVSKAAVSTIDSFKNISNYEQGSKRTVVFHKNPQFDRSQLDCNKMASYGEDRRYDPKTFLQKDVDYINDCSKNSSRKRPLSPEDNFESKDSSYRHFRDYSPTKHHSSSFDASKFSSKRQSRSPPLEFQRRSRHHSPLRSPRNRYISPSSRHRSPHDDYERCSSNYSPRHYYDKQKFYSRSPSRKSCEKSPRYHRHKDKSRSRERSRSPLYRISKEYSPKHKYLKTDLDKSIKMSYKLTSRKDPNFKKKGKISRKSSSESIVSESSRSVSPANVYDKKSQEKNQTKKLLLDRSNDEMSRYKFKTEGTQGEKSIMDQSVKNSAENLTEVHELQNKKHENEKMAILSTNESNLNEEEEKILNIFNPLDVSVINALMSAPQSDLEDTVPMVNLPMLANITDASNTLPDEPHPQISCSQLYPFNPMSISFTSMNNFPSVIPNSILPSPELNPIPSSTYDIYSAATVNSTYVPSDPVDKPPLVFKKRGPATLRSIPVSDYMNTATEDMKEEEKKFFNPEASIKKIKIEMTEKVTNKNRRVSNNNNIKIPLSNVKEHLNRNSPLNSKESVENIKVDINKKITNDNLTLSSNDRFKTQISCSPLIENFKKVRAERHIAQAKVNRIVKDIIEIENLIEQTWGKKTINSEERVVHIKCKNMLNESNDKMNYYIKDAKRLDEKFSKLKEKVPKEIQDITKLEIEDYMSEGHISTEIYKIYDTGRHPCYTCNKQLPNLMSMMEHLHSSEHKQCADASENNWIEEFRKKPTVEDSPNIPLQAVSGIEFMKPLSGFFCTLCKEHLLDFVDGEHHLKSNEHFLKYKNYLKDYPLYENKCLVKRLVKYSVSDKEKKKRVLEEKQVQLAKRKKEEAAADERVKEIIKDQKNKEKQVEELEELNTDDSTYDSQKHSCIKLTLNTDKEKIRVSEKKTSSKDSKPKVVYIGKAPNYKNRPKPWYKRDAFSEKNKSNQFSAQFSTCNILNELKEKISSLPGKKSVPFNEALSSDIVCNVSSKSGNIKTAGKKSNTCKNEEYYSLAEEEQTNSKDDNRDKNKILIGPMNKEDAKVTGTQILNKYKSEIKTVCKLADKTKTAVLLKPTRLDSEIDKTIKSSNDHATLSENVSAKRELLKSEDPSINKAITNILNITDSAIHEELKLYSLSEIKLPENATTISSNDPKKSIVQKISVSEQPTSNMLPLKGTHTVPAESAPMNFSFNQFKSIHTASGKYTEEEKDFMILGINKEDMKPIAVPVPPPMSILNFFSTVPPPNLISREFLPNTNYLNCMNPYRFESYPPIHSNVSPSLQFHQPVSIPERFQQPIPSIEVNQSNVSFLPTAKPPNFKKQVQKFNKSNLITISPSKNVFTVDQSNVNHDKANTGSILSESRSSITKINERILGAVMKEELCNELVSKSSETIHVIDSKIDEIPISNTKEIKPDTPKSSDRNQSMKINKESERSYQEKLSLISEDKVKSKCVDNEFQIQKLQQLSIGDTICDASVVQEKLVSQSVDKIVKNQAEELQKEKEIDAHVTYENSSTKFTMVKNKSGNLIEKELYTPEQEKQISLTSQNDTESERVGQESQAERLQKEMEIDLHAISEDTSTKFTPVEKKFESPIEKEFSKPKQDKKVSLSSQNDVESESIDQESQGGKLQKDDHVISEISSTEFTENKFEIEKELTKPEQEKQVSLSSQNDIESKSVDQESQAGELQKEMEIDVHVTSETSSTKFTEKKFEIEKELPKPEQKKQVSLSLQNDMKSESVDQESQAGELQKEIEIDVHVTSADSSTKLIGTEKMTERQVKSELPNSEEIFTCESTVSGCNVVIKIEEKVLSTMQESSVMHKCITVPETKMRNSEIKDVKKFEHIEDFEIKIKDLTESKTKQFTDNSFDTIIVAENEKLQAEEITKSEMIVTTPETICSINEKIIDEVVNIPYSQIIHQDTNVDIVLNAEYCSLVDTKHHMRTSEQTESVILADSGGYTVENPSIKKDALSINNYVISCTSEKNQTDIQNFEDCCRKDKHSVCLLSSGDLNNIKPDKEFEFMPKLISENPLSNLVSSQGSLINANIIQSSPPTLKSEIYEDSANIVKTDEKNDGFEKKETLYIELSNSNKQFKETCWDQCHDLLIDQNKSNVESIKTSAKVTTVEIECSENYEEINISSKGQKIEAISTEEACATDTSIKPEAEDNESRKLENSSEISKEQNLGDNDQNFEHLPCTSTGNSNVTAIENKYVMSTEYKQDADENISHSVKKVEDNLIENICSISDKLETDHLKNDSDTDEYEEN